MKNIPIPGVSYQELGVSNVGPINKFLGVTTLDPYNAPPGSAVSIKNLSAAGGVFPALATRPNFSGVGTAFGASVQGMGLYKNSELHAVAGGTWRRYSGGTWNTVQTGLNASAQWSFTNFKGNLAGVNLIGVNGVDTPRRFDGTTVTNLTGLPPGVIFKMVDQHGDRLYASDGKALYYSGIAQPQDWTTKGTAGGGDLQIENNSGEDITAIKAGFKHLMVFKRNMFAELFGTGPLNYQFQQIAETGAVGLNAVTMRDQTAYWIHDSGAFQYNGGLPRKEFSTPVSGYFALMNKAAAQNACAITTPDSVLFSFPTGASVVNDTTLEYLPEFGIWSVWQDFAPTSWEYYNKALTYGDATGVFTKAGNGTGVAWEWVSPPFGGGPYSNTHQWYKLWYIIDVPAGSTITVSVSTKAEGNLSGDWTQVTNISSVGNSRRVMVPISQVANSNFLRVKFAGTGPVEMHEFNIQQREMPLR